MDALDELDAQLDVKDAGAADDTDGAMETATDPAPVTEEKKRSPKARSKSRDRSRRDRSRSRDRSRRDRSRSRDRSRRGGGGGGGGGDRDRGRRSRSRDRDRRRRDSHDNRDRRDSNRDRDRRSGGGGGGGGGGGRRDSYDDRGGRRRSRSRSPPRSPRPAPPPPRTALERDNCTVMVQQLPRGCVRRDLILHFEEPCGKVVDVRIISDRYNKGRSKGIAYIEFDDVESVSKAIEMNGTKCVAAAEGRKAPLIITATGSEKNREAALKEKEDAKGGPSRIAVHNLPAQMKKDQLYAMFESFADADSSKIAVCKILPDTLGKGSCGIGYIEFEKSTCAQMAVSSMNNVEIGDRRIRVSLTGSEQDLLPETAEKKAADLAAAAAAAAAGGPGAMQQQGMGMRMPGMGMQGMPGMGGMQPPGMRMGMGMGGGMMMPPMGMPPGGMPPGFGMPPGPGGGLLPTPGGMMMPPPPGMMGRPGGMMMPPNAFSAGSQQALAQNMMARNGAGAAFNPSRQVVLRNVFDPATETDPEWDLDVREEILEEVLENGVVVHIFVDKEAAQGEVYLKFEDIPSAHCTQIKMAKRGYGERSLEATFVTDAAYAEKFPESAEATTPVLLEGEEPAEEGQAMEAEEDAPTAESAAPEAGETEAAAPAPEADGAEAAAAPEADAAEAAPAPAAETEADDEDGAAMAE